MRHRVAILPTVRRATIIAGLILFATVGCRPDSAPDTSATSHGHTHDHDGHTHADHHDTSTDVSAGCTCDADQVSGGWCRQCGHGHVAGLAIESPTFYDAIDAHGHEIDPASFECEACRTMLASEVDGFCDTCAWGFVDGQLYSTRLTWAVARGDAASSTPGCADCRNPTGPHGWCAACDTGRVGPLQFDDPDAFEQATIQYDRLVVAIATIPRCEECAIVMFTGGVCRTCRDRAADEAAVGTEP